MSYSKARFAGKPAVLACGEVDILRLPFLCLSLLVLATSTVSAQSDFGPARYKSAIEAAENELGAYNYAVVEPAVGLGLDLQKNDRHAEAVEALERALHVNRVNKGLHHLDHVPIVDLLVHSHLRLGNWEGAAQQQRLRFWIHKREIATDGDSIDELALERFVDASIHYANWQSKSHQFDTGLRPLHQLREAQGALQAARELLSSRNKIHDERYFKVLNTSAVNNYHMVVYLASNEVDPVTGTYTGDQDISDYLLRQNIINENFKNGTAALRQVANLTAEDPPDIRHAMAKLNYANWQLLFNRPQTARKEYAQAFAAFLEAGLERDAVNQRFAEPERIRSFSLEAETPATIDPGLRDIKSNEAYVVMGFDITRSGEVRNIHIQKSWPKGDRKIRRQARQRLAFSKFRPALVNGEPVEKKDVEIRYNFPKEHKR